MSGIRSPLDDIFDGFSNTTILVVGDLMLDHYLKGQSTRTSPEAPVPVVDISEESFCPGGAGNVAANIISMGGKVALCSVIGADEAGSQLVAQLKQNSISDQYLIRTDSRPTTTKTRVLNGDQQMIRLDRETTEPLNNSLEEQLLQTVSKAVEQENPQVIIFQDYNKGVLTPKVIERIILLAKEKGIKTVVDPKKDNFFSYKAVSLFKPNLKEIRDAFEKQEIEPNQDSLGIADELLRGQLNHELTLITLSADGIYYNDGDATGILPTIVTNLADVSGAGDTVLAAAAICVAQNLPAKTIAELSNIAGGIVCGEVGVVTVDRARFYEMASMINYG